MGYYEEDILKYKNSSLEYFEGLISKYKDIEKIEDEEFILGLEELKDAIESIEYGILLNCQSNEVRNEVNKWIDSFIEVYDTNWSDNKCKILRQELENIINEVEELEAESLYYAKIAKQKLAKSRELNKFLNELQEKMEQNCYINLN